MSHTGRVFFGAACLLFGLLNSFLLAEEKNGAVYFEDTISPLLASLSCNSAKCHGSENGAGGVKLAMFSGDNAADYEILANGYKGRFVNIQNPKDSLLLKKISVQSGKSCGIKLDEESPEFKSFLAWIESGRKFNSPDAPALVALESGTPALIIKMGESFTPKFYGVYADGSKKDLSSKVKLDMPAEMLRLEDKNEIRAIAFGPSYISASINRKFCTISVIAAKEIDGEFPAEIHKNKIDELVAKKQKLANVIPSAICSDSEFLRRLYLDATGLLPTPDQAEAFLKSKDADKRGKLIDAVLASPEFTDRMTMRLADILRIKSEFPSNLWPNGAQAYHTWLRDAIDKHMPYDSMAREMLLSSGSNFKNPPTNFYRAVNVKDADNFAEAVSLVFMGVRTNCIKCHAHPQEKWTRADAVRLADIFRRLKFKASKEWKEEILTLEIPDFPESEARSVDHFVFGEKISSPADRDTREAFANWLLSKDNKYFAKAAVSRMWYWIFGIGLTNPADDIRPNKPATNPELLAFLEESFKESNYDLRHVMKLIFSSNTYQRSYKTTPNNADDFYFFTHRIPARLDAESLNDIISGTLGIYQPFKSITPEPYAFWPDNFKAHSLHDGSVSNPFLTLFGKPGRNSSYLNDRTNTLTMQQVLHLNDSANINQKLKESQYLKDLAKSPMSNEQKIRTLYLAFLTRPPNSTESLIARKHIEKSSTPHNGLKDLAWALINSKEFLFKL